MGATLTRKGGSTALKAAFFCLRVVLVVKKEESFCSLSILSSRCDRSSMVDGETSPIIVSRGIPNYVTREGIRKGKSFP